MGVAVRQVAVTADLRNCNSAVTATCGMQHLQYEPFANLVLCSILQFEWPANKEILSISQYGMAGPSSRAVPRKSSFCSTYSDFEYRAAQTRTARSISQYTAKCCKSIRDEPPEPAIAPAPNHYIWFNGN